MVGVGYHGCGLGGKISMMWLWDGKVLCFFLHGFGVLELEVGGWMLGCGCGLHLPLLRSQWVAFARHGV